MSTRAKRSQASSKQSGTKEEESTSSLQKAASASSPSTMSTGHSPPPSGAEGEGIMMILSPAKTLDLSPYKGSSKQELTWPCCDAGKTRRVAQAMKSRNGKELTKLLSISANLGKTAYEYWQNFQVDEVDKEDDKRGALDDQTKPCIFAFSGIAYQGLQINDWCNNDDALRYLQRNLRIIDPLYGALRPLDRIQPYRLEMATKGVLNENGDDKNIKLHNFWKESVTASIAKDLAPRNTKIVLNVASDEYSSALDANALPSGTRYVKIVFYEPNGRVVTVHAKRARGLMTRFVAEHQCQTLDDVKKFDYEGYAFDASKSNVEDDADGGDLHLVFQRTKPEATEKRKKSDTATNASAKKKKVKK